MRYLCDYDLIEVVSRYRISTEVWDSALMAGNPVFLLGSDDCHNYRGQGEVGRAWTHVWCDSHEDILPALRSGRTMAVIIPHETNDGIMQFHTHYQCPLQGITIEENRAFVYLHTQLDSVRMCIDGRYTDWKKIIGTNFSENLDAVKHYIRFELKTKNKVRYFLNPIFRKNDKDEIQAWRSSNEVDELKTFLYRVPPFLLMMVCIRWILGRRYLQKIGIVFLNFFQRK
jgi:hypothetical protein